jgi:uncharacterized membrane protein YeaQ/YmgE (transglycosylase-associated protein family)
MGIISMAIVGFIVGAIARAVVPGSDKMSWWQTILLGVAGSIVGGFIGGIFGSDGRGEFLGLQVAGWILSIVGAVIALQLWKRVKK